MEKENWKDGGLLGQKQTRRYVYQIKSEGMRAAYLLSRSSKGPTEKLSIGNVRGSESSR